MPHGPRHGSSGAAVAAFAVAVGLLAAGCEGAPCSEPASTAAGAPRIASLQLAGQLDGDPFTVIFAVEFTDGDGNLGHGTAEFFINGNPSDVQLSLFDLFRQSALNDDATGGELAVPLRFAEDVQNGAAVRLGMQVIDEAENRSNCYSLELDFAVQAL